MCILCKKSEGVFPALLPTSRPGLTAGVLTIASVCSGMQN